MPQSTPLISIVIGNYNYGRFVADAVESALRQTYSNVEIIVVDDGSTDGSRSLLERYRDRVRLIFKENGGPTTTIHAGWAATCGEIVMFLDADDILHEEAASTVAAAWGDDIVKVQFPLTVIDSDGNALGFVPASTRPLGAVRIRELVRRCGIYPTPPTSGNAYARRFLSQILPLDLERFPYGVDGALNAVAPLYGAVISLETSRGFYRVHGRNLWAGGPLVEERLSAYITVGQDEGVFLHEHAAKLGIALSNANPLDHSLVFLERRLALRKIAPSHPTVRNDRSLTLFARLWGCVGVYERGPFRSALTLAWFFLTAISPLPIARRLLSYRYVPSSRPAFLARLIRLLRRPVRPFLSPFRASALRASRAP